MKLSTNIITREQCFALYFMCGPGLILYDFAAVLKITDRAFWLTFFLAILFMIPLCIWILKLVQALKCLTVYDVFKKAFGTITCKIFGGIYYIINALLAIFMINMYAQAINAYLLPSTPVWIVVLFFVLVCIVLVNNKIAATARIFQIFMVLIVISYFSTFTIGIPARFRVDFIWPIFDCTFFEFFLGFYVALAIVSDYMLFTMIITEVLPEAKKSAGWMRKGTTFWAVIAGVGLLAESGIVGTGYLATVSNAGISVARFIEIGQSIRGLDVFIVLAYHMSTLGKVVIFFLSMREAFLKLFNAKRPGVPIAVTSIIVFIGSCYLNSFNKAYEYSIIFAEYILFPFCIITLIATAIAVKIKHGARI